MNVKVIVFDLDDTLYNEINFVYSGFSHVAHYFAEKYLIDKEEFLLKMKEILNKKGRGYVFDDVFKYYEIYSKKNVKKAVSIYRKTPPAISLPKKTIDVLKYYNDLNIPLYIVTDGNKIVQCNKVKALEVEKYIKKVFITHRYGRKNSKPSTYCFEKIANIEKMENNQIVYIGDNINKDFVNIKKIGFRTIRIKQGMFKNAVKEKKYHAEQEITSLSEIREILKISKCER